MATATVNLALTDVSYVNEQYPSTHYSVDPNTWYQIGNYIYQGYMFAKLEAFPTAYKHNQLIGVQFRIQTNSDARLGGFAAYHSEEYNANTITWYQKPTIYNNSFVFLHRFGNNYGIVTIPSSFYGTDEEKRTAQDVLGCDALCFDGFLSSYGIKTVVENNDPIYAIVTYDDAVIITSNIAYRDGPKSGYANPRNDITFTWDYDAVGYCADSTWGQSSATFYWKKSTDENYTAVSAGTSKSVTIAANTFPTADTISWYVVGTDDEGTTTQTSVFSFSTTAGDVSTSCLDPVNQVIDGSADYTFSWSIESTDGQAASRTILQYSTDDGATWTDIIDEASQVTSYTVAGGTFPAGSVDWRVQAYNIDGTLGTYTASSFISVTAPAAVQGLAATSVPYSTITWQSSEQQAYQISVDGSVVIKAFGADVYSYTLTDPLDDGTHEISVIVQGIYGYWSQPSMVTVSIQNVSGDAVTLQGETGIDALLTWVTSSAVSDFYVYRDGMNVGHTNNTAFYDKMSLGSHSYYIRNKLADGNYTQSNTVMVTSEAKGTFISLLNGNEWLEITHSENSASEQMYNYNRRYSLNHYSGAMYPVLELSPFEDFYGQYEFGCKDYATAKAFETFRGKEVIIKSRGDVVMVGAMVSLSSHYGDFIKGYTFSIQRIHVEDYIDDTNA